MSTILTTKKTQTTIITLNRPKAINAINLKMVAELKQAIYEAENDDTQIIIINGAGERGLSGGGDIKEMAANNAKNAATFIKNEYELDLQIATSKKPVVAIMAGITMGGGIGVSGHATLRIVTESSRLAMPEAKIGIVPDVGGNLLLANAPGRLGEYLALTAESMNAADAIALGFADLLIPEKRIQEFIAALESENLEAVTAPEIARNYAIKPEASKLLSKQGWVDELIAKAFEKAPEITPRIANEQGGNKLAEWAVSVLQNLIKLAEKPNAKKEYLEFANILRGMSPTSQAVSLAQLARTRILGLSLAEVLQDDLRVLTRLFKKHDFIEGVRALIIDKDQNPKWYPKTIEDLDAAEISAVIDPTLTIDTVQE